MNSADKGRGGWEAVNKLPWSGGPEGGPTILYMLFSLSLLSFGEESFVFQVAIQKFKDYDV